MSFRNADFIRSISEWGAKLYEALSDIDRQTSTLAQQVNGNGKGSPLPPPAVSGLQVSGQNGHFQIAIQDDANVYRDVHYYIEHADNPNFVNPHIIHIGHSRNHSIFLGNVARYWRAYSAYPTSPAGQPAYFGGAQPTPVQGGGAVAGPAFLPSQGSGTGAPGQGLSGPGPVPFRSATGAAPSR